MHQGDFFHSHSKVGCNLLGIAFLQPHIARGTSAAIATLGAGEGEAISVPWFGH
jgi:hypothetical protein